MTSAQKTSFPLNVPSRRYDMAGIGNAAIDIVAPVDESFLAERHFIKGQCTYIDLPTVKQTQAALSSPAYIPGGAAPNTAAGIVALGGSAAIIGLVADDEIGRRFMEDMDTRGVAFPVPAFTDGRDGSTRIFCLATPDGERTFAAYYGVALRLSPETLDIPTLQNASIFHMDGFSLIAPGCMDAYRHAIKVARAAGSLISFNPNDPSVLQNFPGHAAELQDAADIIFCNEIEAQLMTGLNDSTEAARKLAGLRKCVAMTCGARGAVVVDQGQVWTAPPVSMTEKVIDTNGAGDGFAAGFLFGRLRGLDCEKAAILGNRCAASIITRYGARPALDMRDYLAGLK